MEKRAQALFGAECQCRRTHLKINDPFPELNALRTLSNIQIALYEIALKAKRQRKTKNFILAFDMRIPITQLRKPSKISPPSPDDLFVNPKWSPAKISIKRASNTVYQIYKFWNFENVAFKHYIAKPCNSNLFFLLYVNSLHHYFIMRIANWFISPG